MFWFDDWLYKVVMVIFLILSIVMLVAVVGCGIALIGKIFGWF